MRFPIPSGLSTRTYRYAYDQEEVDEFDYVKLGLETHRLLQVRLPLVWALHLSSMHFC